MREEAVTDTKKLEALLPRTVLVRQKTGRKDCAVACFAMADGVSYDEIAERLGPFMGPASTIGLYGNNWNAALHAIGWMENYHYKHALGFQGPWTFQTKPYLFERRAILQVDSVNFQGEQHLVYWDGRELFDPSLLKTVSIESIHENGFHHAWLLSDWNRRAERSPSAEQDDAS